MIRRALMTAIALALCAYGTTQAAPWGASFWSFWQRPAKVTPKTPATLRFYSSATIVFANTTTAKTRNASTKLTNSGGSSATSLVLSGISRPFRLYSSTCGTTLVSNAKCSAKVAFAPYSGVPYIGTLTALADNGVSTSMSVSGTGITPYNIYYVRQDGSAIKANATSSASASTSMSVATFNSSTFADNDHIYFSNKGGNFTSQIVIPSSGSSVDNRIYYRGEPGNIPTSTFNAAEGCVVAGVYNGAGRTHIDIDDITCNSNNTSHFLFQGSTTDVITHNLKAYNCGNQSFQHLNTASVTHYNPYSTLAGDQAVSAHGANTIIIHGGLFEHNHGGIRWATVEGSLARLEAYDLTIMQSSSSPAYSTGYCVSPNGTDSATIIFDRCRFTEYGTGTQRGMDWNSANRNITFRNSIFKLTGTMNPDLYLIPRGAGTTWSIYNCLFTGGSVTSAMVSNAIAGTIKNTVFYNTNNVAISSATGTNDRNAFYNAGAGQGTNKVTTDPLLNASYQPQAGSPLIGAGADLSSIFSGDITSASRTVPWDIGPYKYTP